MKKGLSVLSLLLVCILAFGCFSPAHAETVTGSTKQAKLFYVNSSYKNSYIVLSSSSGVANVSQHNLVGAYKQDGNEVQHGFYRVTQQGQGGNRSFIWAPSATYNKSSVNTCEEVKISFPGTGYYTVTVAPLNSSEAARYWKFDSINYWVYEAAWMTTIESGCRIISPSPFGGGNSGSSSTGNSQAGGGTSGGSPRNAIVYPSSWDTQFKPALSSGMNSEQYLNLNNLSDNNRYTTFWWVIWYSERTDSYPELTAYFNNETVSSIGIRNGHPYQYYEYARLKRFRVEIYTYGAYAGSTYIYLDDINSGNYQNCSLGRTYSGVTKMDFFLDGGTNEGFYAGNTEKYIIYIADMQFYR